MSGMLAALLIKSKKPAVDIVILEQSGQPGGNYREVAPEGFGHCDFAMRFIYETGIAELDRIIRAILPEKEWHIFPDNEKDIAGIFWRGQLQEYSPYLDLRRLPETEYLQCKNDILRNLGQPAKPAINAAEYLLQRYGKTVAGYLIAVLEKLYCLPATELDISATHQPTMNRVILYAEDKMRTLINDETARSVIAWPNQLTLPIKRIPPQNGLYPRRFGMNHVINAMYRQLLDQHVRFIFNARLTASGKENITLIQLENGEKLEGPSLVIAANGVHSAFKLLNPEASPSPPPQPSWLVYLRVSQKPEMGRLYHFYCLDKGYATFRLTHYYNYCPDAFDGTGYPLCIELWSDDASADNAMARARKELVQMNLLPVGCEVVSQAAFPTHNLHGLCSLEYISKIREMRTEVKRRAPGNMMTIGPFAEEGVMLLYDVWRDMYQKILHYFPCNQAAL